MLPWHLDSPLGKFSFSASPACLSQLGDPVPCPWLKIGFIVDTECSPGTQEWAFPRAHESDLLNASVLRRCQCQEGHLHQQFRGVEAALKANFSLFRAPCRVQQQLRKQRPGSGFTGVRGLLLHFLAFLEIGLEDKTRACSRPPSWPATTASGCFPFSASSTPSPRASPCWPFSVIGAREPSAEGAPGGVHSCLPGTKGPRVLQKHQAFNGKHEQRGERRKGVRIWCSDIS